MQRAWFQVYGPRQGFIRWFRSFIFGGWSRAVRSLWLDICIALFVMVAGTVVGWLLVAQDEAWYYRLFPAGFGEKSRGYWAGQFDRAMALIGNADASIPGSAWIDLTADQGRLLSEHDAYLHVDAAQSFGKYPFDLDNPRIDFISVSGHKLYAPKGVGALIMRRRGFIKPPLKPIYFGGGQEKGLRPGTLATPLIAGLGLACELAAKNAEKWLAHVSELKANFTAAVSELGGEV